MRSLKRLAKAEGCAPSRSVIAHDDRIYHFVVFLRVVFFVGRKFGRTQLKCVGQRQTNLEIISATFPVRINKLEDVDVSFRQDNNREMSLVLLDSSFEEGVAPFRSSRLRLCS